MLLTIRRRLVLIVGACCLVVLGAVGWASVEAVDNELTARLDAELVRAAEGGAAVSGVITPETSPEVFDVFRALGPSAYSVTVDDGSTATNVVRAGPAASPDPLPVLSDTDRAELVADPGRVVTVPSEGGGPDQRAVAAPISRGRTLIYAHSLADVDRTVGNLTVALVVISAAGLVVLLVLVLLAGRAVVRPLERIVDETAEIEAGQLHRSIDEDQPDLDTRRLAQGINAMLERLRGAFDAMNRSEADLRDFLSETSHELRTPLAVIRANSEMLATPGLDEEQRERSLRAIDGASRRMSRLVDDLFLLARLDQGHDLDLEQLDLSALVAEAVEDFRVLQPERPVELDGTGAPARVLGDRQRLRQVLDNLLDNVRTHTAPADPLTIAVSRSDREVSVTVQDDGPGVDPADAARVFDRFFRTSATRHDGPGGSGLGLAIVASVLASLGGRAALVPGRSGFGVVLTLPLLPPEGDHDGPQEADRPSGERRPRAGLAT